MPLKACAYRKKGMMLLPRGIERFSARLWRVWNYYKSFSSTSETESTIAPPKPATFFNECFMAARHEEGY